jgi:glycosyltransferase involved in cell wall biosynthesis
MSASRNLGISNAKGAYIAFVDADDVWLPSKLAQQVAVLDSQREAGMVYAPTLYWYSWTGNPEDRARDHVPKLGLEPHTLVKPPTLLTLFLREEAKPPGTCSVLLRREVIEDVGGFVESFRGLYEDQAFFAKVCLRVPVFVVDEYSARYRQHPYSCCAIATNTGAQELAELKYLHWLAEYVSRQVRKDGETWAVLEKILWPYRHAILCYVFRRVRQLLRQGKELQMQALLRTIARWTCKV